MKMKIVPSAAAAVDLIEERVLEPLFAGERRHGRRRGLHPRRRPRQPARRRGGRTGGAGRPSCCCRLLRPHGGAHGGAHVSHGWPAGGGEGGRVGGSVPWVLCMVASLVQEVSFGWIYKFGKDHFQANGVKYSAILLILLIQS